MEMKRIEEWLTGIPSPSTRKSYKQGLKLFDQFLGYPVENLFKSEKAGRKIEQFYVWLKDKGYTQNSCRNLVNGAIQYLKFNDVTVKYRKALGIYKTEISVKNHVFK